VDMVLLSRDPLASPTLATPCRDELMALGFGFGRGGERERRERDKRLHSPLALHALPHTLGYILGRDQVAFADMVLLSHGPLDSPTYPTLPATIRVEVSTSNLKVDL